MKTLGKVVALALAFVMIFSLTAFAYTDDTAGTVETKATGLLTGLRVVGGNPDGSFGYGNTIKRSEYLKILFILKNGPDAEELYSGASAIFPDVTADLWYASYVNWASNLNIVGGYPDGTFKGDREVTVAEAAKMFVTALGYNAADYTFPYGFIDRASKSGLFEDVKGLVADNAALRGQVAVMAYNYLFVEDGPAYSYWDKNTREWAYETPMKATFGADETYGVIVGTSTAAPGNANPKITKEGRVAVKAATKNTDGTFTYGTTQTQIETAVNCDEYLGHLVQIWSKTNAKTNEVETLAFIDETDVSILQSYQSMQVASGIVDNMNKSDIYAQVDGKNIPLFIARRDADGVTEKKIGIYVDYFFWKPGEKGVGNDGITNWIVNGGASDTAFNASTPLYPWNQQQTPFTQNRAASFQFLDYKTAKTVDRRTEAWDKIIVNYWTPGKVTYVSGTSIAISGINGGATIPASQIKGDISGIAKDDIVNVSATTAIVGNGVYDVYTIQKATAVLDVKLNGTSNRDMTFGGVKYGMSYQCLTSKDAGSYSTGEKYDIYLDKAGYLSYIEPAKGQTANLILIADVGGTAANIYQAASFTVTGLLTDGTTKTFELATGTHGVASIASGAYKIYDKDDKWYAKDGTTPLNKSTLNVAVAVPAATGKLFEYKLDTDGKIYSLTLVTGTYTDDGTTVFKLDAGSGNLYKKPAGGAYVIDKYVSDTAVVFNYDNKGAASANDLTDDVLTVVKANELSSFADTKVGLYRVSKDDAGIIDTMVLHGDLLSGDDHNLLSMRSYNYYYDEDSTGDYMFLQLQVAANGTCKFYDSINVLVKNATGNGQSIVNQKILGQDISVPKPNPQLYFGYMKLNSSGKIEKYYETSESNRLNTLTNLAGSSTIVPTVSTGFGVGTVYRGAVLEVKNGTIKIGQGDKNGRAPVKAEPNPWSTVTIDGGTQQRRLREYTNTVILPVSSDCIITGYDTSPVTGVATTASSLTIDAFGRSQDLSTGAVAYVMDFAVRHRNNSTSEPLEIYQIIYYKTPISNYDSQGTSISDDATLAKMADTAVSASGAGTVTNPATIAGIFETDGSTWQEGNAAANFANVMAGTEGTGKYKIVPTQAGASVVITDCPTTLPAAGAAPADLKFYIVAPDGNTIMYYSFKVRTGSAWPTSSADVITIMLPTGTATTNIQPLIQAQVTWASNATPSACEALLDSDYANYFTMGCLTAATTNRPRIQRTGANVLNFNGTAVTLVEGAVYSTIINLYNNVSTGVLGKGQVILRIVITDTNTDPGAQYKVNKVADAVKVKDNTGSFFDGNWGNADPTAAAWTFTPLTVQIKVKDANANVLNLFNYAKANLAGRDAATPAFVSLSTQNIGAGTAGDRAQLAPGSGDQVWLYRGGSNNLKFNHTSGLVAVGETYTYNLDLNVTGATPLLTSTFSVEIVADNAF